MPDAVCLSLKITFGQMEMQKLFTRKRKDPIEALQEQMRSIMEGHGAVTFGVQKLSYRCCSEITRTVCIGTTTRYYPHYEQYRLPNSRGKHRTLQVHWGNRLRLLRFLRPLRCSAEPSHEPRCAGCGRIFGGGRWHGEAAARHRILVAFGLTWAWNTAESSHFLGIPTHVLLTHSLITYIYTHTYFTCFPLASKLVVLGESLGVTSFRDTG